MTRFCPQCGQSFDDHRRCPDDDVELRQIDDADNSLVGSMVGERFRLVEQIGEGGFGTVYRAVQLSMKRQVAVKVLRREIDTGSAHYDRFLREAKLASSLNHPNIVSPVDFGHEEDRSLTYLVMEYVDGVDLGELLVECRLDPALALDIIYQACGGLSDAHRQGIIHRDLKPRNIRLSVISDGALQVKLLDLGIAKPQNEKQDITREDTMPGTTAFLAPEYIVKGELAGYSDQYALGILLYLMLTGQKPFTGNDHQVMFQHIQHQPPPIGDALPDDETVAPEVEQLYQTLAAKEPEDRFDDVRTVRRRIDEIRQAHDIEVVTLPEPPDSVSAETFEPWVAGTVETPELEVEALPSDLISELQGAGADVTGDTSRGNRKRVKLPTPPPLPAEQLDELSESESDSGISLPKPNRGSSSTSKEGGGTGTISLPTRGSNPTPDDAQRNPPERQSVAAGEEPSLGEESQPEGSDSEIEIPELDPDSALGEESQPEESDSEIEIPELESDSEGLESEPSHDPPTSSEESAPLSTLEPPHSSAGENNIIARVKEHQNVAIAAAVGAVLLLGLVMVVAAGGEEEEQPASEPVAEVQQQQEDNSAQESAPAEQEDADDEESQQELSQKELEQLREQATAEGERLADQIAVSGGRGVAERIEEQQQQDASPPRRDVRATGDDEEKEEDDEDQLDELLDQVGSP